MTIEDHGLYVNSGERKRSVFYSMVGTAEYISPESILNRGSLLDPLGVDLWALGCIIYKLFEGKTPFSEESEDKIFDKIKKVDLAFTEETPEEAKDLILKLLVKVPEERLGYQDINEIKMHSFFSGIDFKNITNIDPPDEEIIRLMTSNSKGKSSMNLPTITKSKSVNMNEAQEETKSQVETNFKINESNVQNIQMDKIKSKLKFLEEEMVLEGNLFYYNILLDTCEKKSPWLHYNTRILRLYTTPRIDYLDPVTMQVKGTIFITSETSVSLTSTKSFEIKTSNRVYVFKFKVERAEPWVNTISSVRKWFLKD